MKWDVATKNSIHLPIIGDRCRIKPSATSRSPQDMATTADFQSLFDRQWTFGNTLGQGVTFDSLQDKEMNVIRVLEAVDGSKVGVTQ